MEWIDFDEIVSDSRSKCAYYEIVNFCEKATFIIIFDLIRDLITNLKVHSKYKPSYTLRFRILNILLYIDLLFDQIKFG